MKLKFEQEVSAALLLSGLPLFAGFPTEAFQALIKLLDARDVLPGKVVMMDQEIGRTLYLLPTGSVTVWKRMGGEKKQLAVLKAPNFFGERAMLEESPASAMVKTAERCWIYALERPQFDQLAAQFPAIPDLIRKNMAEIRLKRTNPTPPPVDPA